MLVARTSRYGFTLLETVIALALVACCMALLFAPWKGLFQRITLTTTTTLLLHSLEEARLSALQKHAKTWVVFQHSSQEDRYCTLQREEDASIHPIAPWKKLPAAVAFDMLPESVMTISPEPEVVEALPKGFSQEEEKLGVISYNEQGAIIFSTAESHRLELDLVTTSRRSTFHDQILFSPLTGRAFRKK